MIEKENDPSKPSDEAAAMHCDLELVEHLMDGTNAMRKAGTKYLPQWPQESNDAYSARIGVSTLFPAYAETVANATGRVLSKPVVPNDDVPDAVGELLPNIDMQGNDLNSFAYEWFKRGLADGLCHVLVDYPTGVTATTVEEEKASGARPFAAIIPAESVLGWRSANVRGVEQLTMLRYKVSVTEDAGEFGSHCVEEIRVLEPNQWRSYRKTDKLDKDKWVLHSEGVNALGVVPLVTFYTGRTGFMTAKPPLLELAHLNVKHWQSQSDQDNILHVARVPILYVAGVTDENYSLTVGSSTASKFPEPTAKIEFAEHSGAAIEAGRDSLSDIVDQMKMAGAKLLIKDQQATKTATQAAEEGRQETSPLERYAMAFADSIANMLQLFAMWKGLDDGGSVTVSGNFDVDYLSEVSIQALVQLASNKLLTQQTLFDELQRRGVLSDKISWETELQRKQDALITIDENDLPQ